MITAMRCDLSASGINIRCMSYSKTLPRIPRGCTRTHRHVTRFLQVQLKAAETMTSHGYALSIRMALSWPTGVVLLASASISAFELQEWVAMEWS